MTFQKFVNGGSVKVNEMTIESYAHVHHIVSNICGQKIKSVSPGKVISSVFPGGDDNRLSESKMYGNFGRVRKDRKRTLRVLLDM